MTDLAPRIPEREALLQAIERVAPVLEAGVGASDELRRLPDETVEALDAGAFGAWEGAEFAPEKEFLEEAAKIEGITTVETQTYTFMSL